MPKKIFISHAAADAEVAKLFVNMLVLGIGVKASEIFCSSITGMSIPTGENFKDYIKQQIQEPTVVIALLSPQYAASQFCMSELGASWAMSHTLLPLIFPTSKFSDFGGVLSNIQITQISDAVALSGFMDTLKTKLKAKVSSALWQGALNNFIEQLPEALKGIKPPAQVALAEHNKVQKDLKEAIEQISLLQKQISNLEAKNIDLAKLKNATEVKQVNHKHASSSEELDALETEVREMLKPLPKVMAFVAFRELGTGNSAFIDYKANPDLSDEAQGCLDKKYLATEDQQHWYLNTSNTKVKRLADAVNALSHYLSRNLPEDVAQAFEEENDFAMEIDNRDYWQYALDPRLSRISA